VGFMKENYDPKRDPEMVSHYVSHAISRARIEIIRNLHLEKSAKEYLREKLGDLFNDNSSKYKLSQNILNYLDNSPEWTTIEEVEKFCGKWKKLRLEKL
jgi:hypothetical protein